MRWPRAATSRSSIGIRSGGSERNSSPPGRRSKQISEFWGKEATTAAAGLCRPGFKGNDTRSGPSWPCKSSFASADSTDRCWWSPRPTGTGWLDPGAVDTLEYLHAGDTAIVSMQYSYLPSWITILVDPTRSRDSATLLFDEVYDHWKTLPKDSRPKLYLHGLSLGALGSAASADLFTCSKIRFRAASGAARRFRAPSGRRATRYRNPDSPMWLPTFRDGSMLRFTGRENSLHEGGNRWGPMRFVYIQHASDPMTFFSPELLYRRPDWLVGQRGPDVSPYLRWFPIVTFLQAGFDMPMATTVPRATATTSRRRATSTPGSRSLSRTRGLPTIPCG